MIERSARALDRYGWQVSVVAAAAVLILVATDLPLLHKGLAVAGGLLLGAWGGLSTARALEHRVDRGAGLVLYFEDTAPYGLLLPLGLLSLSPFAFGVAIGTVTRSEEVQGLLQFALCGLAIGWLAHDVMLYIKLRRLASRLGPLQFQWFYTRSSTGQQGMIGKTGVVTTECSPTGYVRIGAELWKARSLDGARLTVEQNVIVRRLDRLVLLVDGVN